MEIKKMDKFNLTMDKESVDKLVQKLEAKKGDEFTSSRTKDAHIFSTQIGEHKVNLVRVEHHYSTIDPAGGGYDDYTKEYYRIESYKGENPVAASLWEQFGGKATKLYKQIAEKYDVHLRKIKDKDHQEKRKQAEKQLGDLLNG